MDVDSPDGLDAAFTVAAGLLDPVTYECAGQDPLNASGSGIGGSIDTVGVFFDVGSDHWAYPFIRTFAAKGITAGCGGGNFCPRDNVTRAQMAVFLLRAMHGSAYLPPPPVGVFNDVDVAHWAAAWIEQLAAEGVTTGCGRGGFCPEDPVTRAQMALFIVRAFGL